MTPLFEPYIETKEEIHRQREWTRREAARHYVRLRRDQATVSQVFEVRLRGPTCVGCAESDPFYSGGFPQISASSWDDDVAIEVDEDEVERIRAAIAAGDDPCWRCVRCHRGIRPWDGDDVYVATKYLEEDHSLEAETLPKQVPSEAMRAWVLEFYGNKCFGCGVHPPAVKLTIDHIVPRSRGGDAAFRNLQPLCEPCQQAKADADGEVVTIHDNIYFSDPPGDSYEGLFW